MSRQAEVGVHQAQERHGYSCYRYAGDQGEMRCPGRIHNTNQLVFITGTNGAEGDSGDLEAEGPSDELLQGDC